MNSMQDDRVASGVQIFYDQASSINRSYLPLSGYPDDDKGDVSSTKATSTCAQLQSEYTHTQPPSHKAFANQSGCYNSTVADMPDDDVRQAANVPIRTSLEDLAYLRAWEDMDNDAQQHCVATLDSMLVADPQCLLFSEELQPRCFEHGCAGRTFSCMENYQRHLRERRGGGKTQCPICNREFSRKSNMTAHIRSGKCKPLESLLQCI
jgi:hypothetical protein